MSSLTEALLHDFRLTGYEDVYVVGSLDARVTIYSQQVRALNLVHALKAQDRLQRDCRVLVIGAGVAGIMAAVAAADVGARVSLAERRAHPLHLQTGSSRYVHPHILDWPDGADGDEADVPFFPWRADSAHAVAQVLMRAWKQQSKPLRDADRLRLAFDTEVRELHGIQDSPQDMSRAPYSIRTPQGWGVDDQFGVVILACGFGVEAPTLGAPLVSYWRNDDMDQPELGRLRTQYLVSGNGDGGLVDALRVRVLGFRPDLEFVRTATVSSTSPDAVRKLALKLDDGPEGVVDTLFTDFLQKNLQPFQLRSDTEVTLAYRSGQDDAGWSAPQASRLNRFLFCWLLASERLEAHRRRLANTNPPDGLPEEFTHVRRGATANSFFDPNRRTFSVAFEDGRHGVFDRVIIRHGAVSPLLELQLKELGVPAQVLERRQARLAPGRGRTPANRATAARSFEPTFSRWLLRKDGLHTDLPVPRFDHVIRSEDRSVTVEGGSREIEDALLAATRVSGARRLVVGILRGRIGAGKGTALRRLVMEWSQPSVLLDCSRYANQCGVKDGAIRASCAEALRAAMVTLLDGPRDPDRPVLLGIDNLDRHLLSYEFSGEASAKNWVHTIIGALPPDQKARIIVLVSLDHRLQARLDGTQAEAPTLTVWGHQIVEAFDTCPSVEGRITFDFELRASGRPDPDQDRVAPSAAPWLRLDASVDKPLDAVAIYRDGWSRFVGPGPTRADLIRATAQKTSHRYRDDVAQWERLLRWLAEGDEPAHEGAASAPSDRLEKLVELLQDRKNDTFSLLELVRSHFGRLAEVDPLGWSRMAGHFRGAFRALASDHATMDRHGRALSPIASMLSALGAFPPADPKSPLRNANLRDAALFDADLSRYVFVAGDFRGAMLRHARLTDASSRSTVRFIGCDLAGSDLAENPEFKPLARKVLLHCTLPSPRTTAGRSRKRGRPSP